MAPLLPPLDTNGSNKINDADSNVQNTIGGAGTGDGATVASLEAPIPPLFHKVQNKRSILCLLTAHEKIYAGTQNGDLLIWSLETFELLLKIHAHRSSLLCLHLSEDGKLLFSSAGDAIVNVWCTSTLDRLYSIYSTYDVGDVFCIAYSSDLQTVYLGAQNTSIQWYDLSQKDLRPSPDPTAHPSYRNHRFFDSKGPGGISTPRPASPSGPRTLGGQDLEIDKDHMVQYAHFGYVYCMLLARGLSGHSDRPETLLTGGGDGTVKLWPLNHAQDGALNNPLVLENGDESVLTMALDGTLLYCGRLDGNIDVWDLDTRQLIRIIKTYTADILTLAVGHGLVFGGASNGIAKVYNARHENVNKWKAHEHLILASAVASCHDKDIYITGGNDGCIVVWDISGSVQKTGMGSMINNEKLVLSLQKLVSYRTVSSKPEYAQDCRRGASYLRSLLKQFGAETRLLNAEENRNPVVFARFRAKKDRTSRNKSILYYGHYDVVAADDKERKWSTDPFEMQGIDGYVYGRGVSDNKGPTLAAVYAVADLVAEQQLASDIVFLIEGEEECGSRGFQEAILKNKIIIGDVHWILLANSYWLDDDIPCLTYGLRGVVRARIEVAGERPDLHSGVDGSKLINEALKDLVALLATLTGSGGAVNIPGFYDNIPAITKAEDERYRFISETLIRHNPDLGNAKILSDSFKARWREPSLTIHRIKNSGPANLTIISRAATAEISIRLVPNQTTEAIKKSLRIALEDAFEGLHSENELTITFEQHAEPWLGDPNNEVFRTLEEAIMEVWKPSRQPRRVSYSKRKQSFGEVSNKSKSATSPKSPKLPPTTSSTLSSGGGVIAPLTSVKDKAGRRLSQQVGSVQKPFYIREGGSIAAIRFLEQEFNAPAAHLPCGQASDSAHLDNERLRILNLYNSREIFKRVFKELPLR